MFSDSNKIRGVSFEAVVSTKKYFVNWRPPGQYITA